MTDEDLRTLLRERVEDLATTDLSGSAWRAGRQIRTRRRLGAVAGVAAATLAVVGIAAVVGGEPATDSDPGPSTSTPAVDRADATVAGAPVYWSPDLDAEAGLPDVDGPLPATIDVGGGVPRVEDEPVDRAVAAFAVSDGARLDRVVLVTPDGYRTLTLPDGARPRADMLAADGASVELPTWTYSFATGEWSSHPASSPVWPDVPQQVVDADRVGAPRTDPDGARTALAYGYGSSVPAPPGGGARPETVVVTPVLGPPTILAIDAPVGAGRYKECCPVAGWLDDDTVVYESRSGDPRLVAWTIGTHDFGLVSRIAGLAPDEWYVAAYADLSGSADLAGGDDDGQDPAAGDASTQGVPVWWSPDLAQELDLPWIDEARSPLPREIDVSVDAADVADEPIDRALAAFARDPLRPGVVALLGPDGEVRSLDISELDPLQDPAGNASAAATATMLSPDGRHLVFVQRGHVMVYALASGDWTRIETGPATNEYVTWADDETLYLPPEPSGGEGPLFGLDGERLGTDDLSPPEKAFEIARAFDNTEGPWRANHAGDVAQSWGMGGPFLPVRDQADYLGGPAYLSVVGPAGTRALAFMTEVDRNRFLDAPPVAGWLDDGTVLYESRADDRDLLVAWEVGTRQFARVATITGSTTASFADLQGG